MKVVKIFFALFCVILIIGVSVILWKKANYKEQSNLSTVKQNEESVTLDENSTKVVENQTEESTILEETEETESFDVVEKVSDNDVASEESSKNASSNQTSQVFSNASNQQSNVNTSTSTQGIEQKQENQVNNQTSDNQTIYTIENDIPADSKLIVDALTYEDCEKRGQNIIEAHQETECQYGCTISCRSVMGKYTKETIGFMLTIRIMDGVGTVLPFSRG